ncbi:SusC/RagA family TonB-linked outer membrane protein [Pontibacter sp. BT310]|jgi:TonB-linked SusC/RagA family outer membrane protein|uniref:SusC/RagA family TonB-linked outer membrane protein n=1 Tax=Pontibacter populi TaxID=890055 RepID=A0ABS6X768_9BACT|nr:MULTISPECIES: SusC/RagA family TonB-linked outer membrane protein [Pontibacter]MBJ6116984.1 SusC/RagA family TonB-linked outer membrane protein [Pontibacter sp. BT310]MBR0569408.1 SusC/RagA family TonB-linked outer membrane protein [Microvirga sp. STS03]MBW3363837.1 SusC/RagA family TonB-linked outer membrane protein [Pontibacter populi]
MKKLILLSLVMLLTLSQEAFAQGRTVTGKVTDQATGQPLPGVAVIVQGTTVGTSTNVEGAYTINVPAGGTALQFRYIGYETTTREIGNASTIDVALGVNAQQLQEVVVTALGVEREERSLGYSASTVQSEEITRARATSPMNSLQGKVAGVNITTASGQPGASTKVILRGYSSIGGDNNPLYVVDGTPITNGSGNYSAGGVNRTQDFGNRANDINPDDIASITILKGAAATSLYGSRAANGAILITTKRGQAGEKPKIEVTSSATLSRPLFLPQLQNRFGQGWSARFAFEENGSWGPKFDGRQRVWGNVVNNSQQLKPFVAQEDNLKDFFETGQAYLNTVSVSGGSEQSTYYLSYSNATENGIIPTNADQYDRNTVALRGSTKGEKLSASSSLNYVRKDASVVTTGQGGGGTTLFQEIIQIPRDISIVDFEDLDNPFNTNDNYFTLYAQNPYWPLKMNGNDLEENRFFGNITLDYKLNSWLTLSARGGGDVAAGVLKDWIRPYDYTPGSPNATASPSEGFVAEINTLARELNSDIIASTNNDLTENIHLNALAGFNVNERYGKNTTASITNLSIPDFFDLSNTTDPVTATTLTQQRRLIGVYGQTEFSFMDYLFLTLSARNDWSSTLPKNDNSFFYPAANVAWVFSDMFTDLPSALSYGKIRASWGQAGNDAPVYSIDPVFVPGGTGLGFGTINFPIAGINAFELSNQIGNRQLQPEITTEMEVGTNLGFFENRVNVDLAFYNRKTTDQILAVPVDPTSGFTTQIQNFGEVRNRGVELLLSGSPIQAGDFSWDVRYNFTKNDNEVTELKEGLDEVLLTSVFGIRFVAEKGEPLGVFRGIDYQRDSQGRIIVNPATGYPLAGEEVKFGTAQPDFTMGLYNTFNYKDFSLSFGFDYRKGGLFYSYTQRLTQFVGNSTNTLYNDRLPFIVPNSVVTVDADEDGVPDVNGEGDLVTVPNTTPIEADHVVDYWNPSSNPPIERDHLRERDFLKMRELTLGYNLPTTFIERTPFSNANISFVARNVFVWTPDNNNIIDPESTTFGNDLLSEFGEFAGGPTTRSFGLSLKFGF